MLPLLSILAIVVVANAVGFWLLRRRWLAWGIKRDNLERFESDLLSREDDVTEREEKALRFAWSIRRRWDRPMPGPEDEPVLYILPGGVGRTNSCEEARRAWLDAAVEAGVQLDVKPHEKLVELYDAKRKAAEARSG